MLVAAINRQGEERSYPAFAQIRAGRGRRKSPRTSFSLAPAARTSTAPATLDQAAKDYRDLLTAISTKRQILRGGQSANLIFQSVDGKVLRLAMVTKTGPLFYTWHNGQVEDTAPEVTLSL